MDTEPPIDISILAKAAEGQTSPEVGDDLRAAIHGLMDQTKDSRHLLIESVSEILPGISSGYGVGTLAVWLGAMVENGRDPGLSFKAVRDTWVSWARLIQVDDQSELVSANEPAFQALEDCARSLVSHCSKNEDLRGQLVQDGGFAAEVLRLSPYSTGAMWLEQLIMQASGDLIVLNMERCVGALVRYHNISNCFHLFTLLQGTFCHWLPLLKRPAQALLDSARGEGSGLVHDEALWHYQQPMYDAPQIAQSIWGEGNPQDIQSIDNQQVLVLWPMILKGRSWDSGFFEPLLSQRRPSIEIIRELNPAEFVVWKSKLKPAESREVPTLPAKSAAMSVEATGDEKSPWWQFWRR